MKIQTEGVAMNPSIPKIKLPPSTQLRKVLFRDVHQKQNLKRGVALLRLVLALGLLLVLGASCVTTHLHSGKRLPPEQVAFITSDNLLEIAIERVDGKKWGAPQIELLPGHHQLIVSVVIWKRVKMVERTTGNSWWSKTLDHYAMRKLEGDVKAGRVYQLFWKDAELGITDVGAYTQENQWRKGKH
ncbi:MAG: hypothetical protein HOP33_06815 [Verrucomicrobia bacterium]|nr:hypothetical protein [Verrucomicrobiota bacterium]